MWPGGSPEAILKRCYARGEIDHEEYQRRLTDQKAAKIYSAFGLLLSPLIAAAP